MGTPIIFTRNDGGILHSVDESNPPKPVVGKHNSILNSRKTRMDDNLVVMYNANEDLPILFANNIYTPNIFCVKTACSVIGVRTETVIAESLVESGNDYSKELCSSYYSIREIVNNDRNLLMVCKNELSANVAFALMSHKGIPIDLEKMEKFNLHIAKAMHENQESIKTILGTGFSVLSVNQFLGSKSIQPIKITRESTSVLLKSKNQEARELGRLLQVSIGLNSQLKKWDEINSFMDRGGKVVRTHYKTNDSATGRISSEKPALQNTPNAEILDIFTAKEGHIFIKADYKMQEIRCAAAVIGEGKLRELSIDLDKDIYETVGAELFAEAKGDFSREIQKETLLSLLYGGNQNTVYGNINKKHGIKISKEDAGKVVRTFYKTFPEAETRINNASVLANCETPSQYMFTNSLLKSANKEDKRVSSYLESIRRKSFDYQKFIDNVFCSEKALSSDPEFASNLLTACVGWGIHPISLKKVSKKSLMLACPSLDVGKISEDSEICKSVEKIASELGVKLKDSAIKRLHLPYVETPYGRRILVPFGADVRYSDRKRTLINYQIQGAGADMIKKTASLLHKDDASKILKYQIVASTHDDVILMAPIENEKQCVELLERCCAQASRKILNGIEVPVKITTGVTFAELAGIEPFDNTVTKEELEKYRQYLPIVSALRKWEPKEAAVPVQQEVDAKGVFKHIKMASQVVSCEDVVNLPIFSEIKKELRQSNGRFLNPFRKDKNPNSFDFTRSKVTGEFGYLDRAVVKSEERIARHGSSYDLFCGLWAKKNGLPFDIFTTKGKENIFSPYNKNNTQFMADLRVMFLKAASDNVQYPKKRQRQNQIEVLGYEEDVKRWEEKVQVKINANACSTKLRKILRPKIDQLTERDFTEDDKASLQRNRHFSSECLDYLSMRCAITATHNNASGFTNENGEVNGWALVDKWTVQCRRIDNKMWINERGEEIKAMSAPNSVPSWLFDGINAHESNSERVILCEGGPDYVAATDFMLKASEKMKIEMAALPQIVAILGANASIDEGVAEAFKDKQIFIYKHCDESTREDKTVGTDAALKWASELDSKKNEKSPKTQIVSISDFCNKLIEGDKSVAEECGLTKGGKLSVKDVNDVLICWENHKKKTGEELFNPVSFFGLVFSGAAGGVGDAYRKIKNGEVIEDEPMPRRAGGGGSGGGQMDDFGGKRG